MEFLQLAINGLVAASLYALVAVGFAAIYRTSGFLHFGHAASFAIAPYMTLAMRATGIPLTLSMLAGVVASAALGALTEVFVFRPLRRRHAPPLVPFLASLGLFIFLQNVISLLFGDDVKSIRPWTSSPLVVAAGARVTTLQVAIVFVAVATFGFLFVALRRTRMGLLVRATADDASLANATGIRADRVALAVFTMASGLGGLAGVLSALDTDMTPSMGVNILFLAIAAFILGGARNILGGFAGALVVALLRQGSAWFFGAKWQEAVVFMLILAVFVCRPTGLSPERAART
jgi:branched-chain amino acid transport system permease protein